jgi:hypothetical protein
MLFFCPNFLVQKQRLVVGMGQASMVEMTKWSLLLIGTKQYNCTQVNGKPPAQNKFFKK